MLISKKAKARVSSTGLPHRWRVAGQQRRGWSDYTNGDGNLTGQRAKVLIEQPKDEVTASVKIIPLGQ